MKQIVFFCANAPYVMVYKIARELKVRGYELVLITVCTEDKFNDRKLYEQVFDKIIISNFQVNRRYLGKMIKGFPSLIKSLLEINKLRPYITFNISRPNYISAWYMKYFNNSPQIYFPYDISSQLFHNSKDAVKSGRKLYEIKAERYCFENADGILHKGSPKELNHLKKYNMLGKPLNMTKNIICFQSYCSDEFIVPINKNKLSKIDGELHFVHTGSLYGGEDNMNYYIKFINALIKDKIHIHFYTKTQHLSIEEDKVNMKPVLDEFKDNKYVHFEFCFPPKELIQEISKYDYGFWIDLNRQDNEHKFTTGNKFSTYLEAGLPFGYEKTFEFVDGLMKYYKLQFKIDVNDMDKTIKELRNHNYTELEQKVIKARNHFNLNNNMDRLEKFIQKVANR